MTAKIGIISEHKPGEGRIPLTPLQIQKLQIENSSLSIIVQASNQRAFQDQEFRSAGIKISGDVSDANLVMAVKEIDIQDIYGHQAYLYFSHTIKGQDYNMPMLQHILDVGATLIDYELIRDDLDRRLVFFGRHAGLAGMVNTLWSYGQRERSFGREHPFAKLKQAQDYHDLQEIKSTLKQLSPEIDTWMSGKPALVIGITGYGNVSKGAQEILDIFPCIEVSPETLLHRDISDFEGKIVKVVFREIDMFEPIDPEQPFELQEYFNHPEKYRSKFNAQLANLNILVNCIYWDTPYPRLITNDEIKAHYSTSPTLQVVGDITCDIDGAIQFNVGSTLSPDPVYVVNPINGEKSMGFKGKGILVMAVDNLPTELPRESSEAFGTALLPFVPEMGVCDYSQSFEHLMLPSEVKRAVIAHGGRLTPEYEYLEKYLKA